MANDEHTPPSDKKGFLSDAEREYWENPANLGKLTGDAESEFRWQLEVQMEKIMASGGGGRPAPVAAPVDDLADLRQEIADSMDNAYDTPSQQQAANDANSLEDLSPEQGAQFQRLFNEAAHRFVQKTNEVKEQRLQALRNAGVETPAWDDPKNLGNLTGEEETEFLRLFDQALENFFETSKQQDPTPEKVNDADELQTMYENDRYWEEEGHFIEDGSSWTDEIDDF